jgi:3-oxoacyl-[acyl-carrier-protein] synthase III
MIPVRILGTASSLPGRAVSTAEVAARCVPPRDAARLEASTGISERHWVDPETLSADVGVEVLRLAIADAGVEAASIERLIFVSSAGGDWFLPATATSIIGALGLNGRCEGFDLSNACVGFLSAFDLGARSIATGTGNVAVVVVELARLAITPTDHRIYGLIGDATAALVLGPARADEGIRAVILANDAADGPTVGIPNPHRTGKFEVGTFSKTAQQMASMAVDALVRAVRTVLSRAELSLDEVEHIVLHQPNGPYLMAFIAALGIDPQRIIPIVQRTGSIGAASVAMGLDLLWHSGKVRPGDRILLASVGSPVVSGAVLYQVAP